MVSRADGCSSSPTSPPPHLGRPCKFDFKLHGPLSASDWRSKRAARPSPEQLLQFDISKVRADVCTVAVLEITLQRNCDCGVLYHNCFSWASCIFQATQPATSQATSRLNTVKVPLRLPATVNVQARLPSAAGVVTSASGTSIVETVGWQCSVLQAVDAFSWREVPALLCGGRNG